MENKSHALAAGAFLLALCALLAAVAVWLSRDTSEQRVYEISSREGVTGLQPQAGVRYKGVLVGRVTAIGLDPNTLGNVLVRIAVSERAPITTTTYASLGFQGVTGLSFVQLDDPTESSPALATAAGVPARIPMRAGLVSRLTAQGSNLLNQLEEASQRLNGLLAQDNQQNLMAAVTNLGQAAASMQQLTVRADAALAGQGGAGSLNLPQLAAQADATLKTLKTTAERLQESAEVVRNSATEFRRLSTRMTEPDGTLDKIGLSTESVANTSQSVNRTMVPRLNRAADDAARAARQVGALAEGLNDNPQSLLTGKGPVPPGPGEPGFVVPQGPVSP